VAWFLKALRNKRREKEQGYQTVKLQYKVFPAMAMVQCRCRYSRRAFRDLPIRAADLFSNVAATRTPASFAQTVRNRWEAEVI
jgi:hypothetical protein